MDFPVYSASNAPVGSRSILEANQKKLGFVPNLMGVFAGAPSAISSYQTLTDQVEATSFSPTETQLVLLTISAVNDCDYCVSAHSTIAGMQKVDPDVIAALRDGTPLANPKLEALRSFTRAVVEKRGWVEDDLAAFEAAGYESAHVLEVITATAMKTLSNYVNHIAKTPLDAAFQANAWTRPAGVA